MDPLIIVTLVLFLSGIVYLLYVFPWILKYYKLNVIEKKIDTDKFIIISDLHLHPKNCIVNFLYEIIEKENVNTVIIAGDLFEFHRKMTKEELKELFKKCFSIHNKKLSIYYTPSKSSHDPILENSEIEIDNDLFHIIAINGCLKIISKYNLFYISHGDYVARNGGIAGAINKLAQKFGKKLFLEKKLKKIIGTEQNAWLIMGHTHIPGIDTDYKVANTGAWKTHPMRESSNTYILVSEDAVTLKNYRN